MSQWHVAPSGATAPTCHTQPPVATRKSHHGAWPLAASWDSHSALETPPSGGTLQGELRGGRAPARVMWGKLVPQRVLRSNKGHIINIETYAKQNKHHET